MKVKILCIFFLFSCTVFAASLDEIKLELIKEYRNNFPDIVIEDVELYPQTLPSDFDQYLFLRLARVNFEKASAYARAEFKTPEKTQRNLFFRYFIKANLKILRAKRDIKRGEKISLLDVNEQSISFDKVPNAFLSQSDELNLIAKTSIKKNSILKKTMFKMEKLVKKNELIRVVLEDEGVQITIELIAVESGNLGQTIKLRNKEGKIIKGVVSGKNQVSLQ